MKRFFVSIAILALTVPLSAYLTFQTAFPFSVASFLLNHTGYKIEGLDGRLKSGFRFASLAVETDERVSVEYSPREFSIDRLRIGSVTFREIDLERPPLGNTAPLVASLPHALFGLKLAPSPFLKELSIKDLEIGETRYQPALQAPELSLDSIRLRGFRLAREGVRVESLSMKGKTGELVASGDTRWDGGTFRYRLHVEIPASYFIDAKEPLRIATAHE